MYVMCSSCCYSHCKCNCVPLFSSFVLITTRVYRACHFDHASFSCSYVLFILHIFSEWRKKSYTYYRSIICIIARVHQCTLAVWINRNACSKVLSLRRLYKLLFGQKIILSQQRFHRHNTLSRDTEYRIFNYFSVKSLMPKLAFYVL